MERFVFQYDETIFYLAVWFTACITGISGAVWNRDSRNQRDLLNIGFVSGTLGFVVVVYCVTGIDSADHDNFYFLALASLVGLYGKWVEKVLRRIVQHTLISIAGKFGVDKEKLRKELSGESIPLPSKDTDPPSQCKPE